MKTIEQHLARLYHPYWCQSDPRKHRWRDTLGPSGVLGGPKSELQAFPDVGLFNLLWLMLDNPDYNGTRTAAEAEMLNHVIYNLQQEPIGPMTLSGAAAAFTLPQFRDAVMMYKPRSWQRLLDACDRKLENT